MATIVQGAQWRSRNRRREEFVHPSARTRSVCFAARDELTSDINLSPARATAFENWGERSCRSRRTFGVVQICRVRGSSVTKTSTTTASGSHEPAYGYVWRPTYVVAGPGARIATAAGPGCPPGWTWVDNAHWGFAPFHDGRWAYVREQLVLGAGAALRPHAVYAPALVAWTSGPSCQREACLSAAASAGSRSDRTRCTCRAIGTRTATFIT